MIVSKMFRACFLLAIMLVAGMYSYSVSAITSLAAPIPGPYMPTIYWKYGAVYTRALVLDQGYAQYVEIDTATGAEVGYIGSLVNEEWREAWQTSADSFKAYQQRYQHHMKADENNSELPSLMSVQDYNQKNFTTVDGKPVTKAPLGAPYTHVLVINEKRIFSTSGEFLIVDKYRLDPSQSIAQDSIALLVDKEGSVIFQSRNNIGFRVGFYGNPDDPMQESNQYQRRESGDQIFGPLAGVPLQMGFTGGGVTDTDGKYSFTYMLPPCPGFSFHYTTAFWATMYYQRFNPHHDGIMPYIIMRNDYDFCMGYEALDHRVIPIKASLSSYKSAIDFPIDLIVLNGFASIAEDGKNVPIGDVTKYEAVKDSGDKQLYRIARQNRDFDSDGQPDNILLGSIESIPADDPEQPEVQVFNPAGEQIQGVWFSKTDIPAEDKAKIANAHALQKQLFEARQKGEDDAGITQQLAAIGNIAIQPDFTRQADWSDNFDDFGKLSQISKEDLLKTDIYVVRSSNGELVYEREGIPEDELDSGVKEGRFNYTVKLRGGLASKAVGNYQDFSQWQIDDNIKPKLQQREADHLRAGELVEVYAINRVTGYMGVMPVRLKTATGGSLLLSFPIDELKMTRPNLKVWSTRKTKQELGLKKGQIEDFLIGNEGAGLTQDSFLALYTEWTNHDGSPIPAVLSDFGYTARLASLVGDQILGEYNASSVSQFSVVPGIQLQALMLFRDNVDNQRFYVQVNAKPEAESPDFSSSGIHQGKTGQRPDEFVPFKVPVFDEDATSAIQDSLNAQKRADPDFEWEKADPIYHYVYRPEYQFSQYTLQIDEINRKPSGEAQINLLDQDLPIVTGTDELLDLLHLIAIDENLPLDAWSTEGEQELIFDINGLEVKASVNQGTKKVTFDDLSVLDSLSVEDFISIRLFANNDSANILWQYTFEYIFIHSRVIGHNNQTDDTYYITADDPQVDLKAGILGYAYRSAEDKKELNMLWSVDGDGRFERPFHPSNDIGIFDNTLLMSPKKGAKAVAAVTLKEAGGASSAKAKWKTVEVLAGKPASITIEKSAGSVVSLGQGDAVLTFTVRDGSTAANLVEDGTAVNVTFKDSLVIKEQELLTENGVAYIVLTGGEFAKDSTEIVVSSGEATATTTLGIEPLVVTFDPEKTILDKQEIISITATVTKPDGTPAIGVPVSLSAGKGLFAEQELTTDILGKVETTFTAGLNELEDEWVAQVGYVAIEKLAYEVKSAAEQSIDAQNTMLLANESMPGVLKFDAYGVETSAGYQTEASVSVRGKVGDTLTIGDMADPNLEPLLAISMNQIDYGNSGFQFNDDHGFNPGLIQEVTVVHDHPLGGGRSAAFQAASSMTVAASGLLDLKDNIGFRLDIKPQSEGQVLDYAGGMKLAYRNSQFYLSIRTSNGIETLSAPAELAKWHRIAAKISGSELQLYINGELHKLDLVGVFTESVGDISMGGLDAVIRGFRVYDYGSLPLITFADGSIRTTLQSTTDLITVKSLGNLGKQMLNSQMKSLRVALITDTQRNYASLLTTAGYQEIALKYLFTVSPQRPVASVGLPLGFVMSSAHAWNWDSVWEGVKTTVGVLIPYEDFIIIGEQLVYLYNKDWENFDATALAFASVGAATIIPVAKPLKPLLAPIKKLVDGMRRFPGAKHFAGAMGTAAKEGLSGKTEKLIDLLPFILIAIELYNDPEIFEFMMEAIENEDDLWIWIKFIAELVELEGGLDELAMYSSSSAGVENPLANSPFNFFIGNAFAKPRNQAAQEIMAILKPLKRKLVKEGPKQFTKTLRHFFKTIKESDSPKSSEWKQLLKSSDGLSAMSKLGHDKLKLFILNSKNWRVNRWVVLMSLVYLAEQQAEGKLAITADQWTFLTANAFSGFAWTKHGAMFQISQMAYYQLNSGNEHFSYKIKAIEATRPAYLIRNGEIAGKPYQRRIDIVLENEEGQEIWVETKSLGGPFKSNWFTPSLDAIKSDTKSSVNPVYDAEQSRSYYRQFFHDMRSNIDFINTDNQRLIINTGANINASTNVEYLWLFQQFKTRAKTEPPVNKDIRLARSELCKSPRANHVSKMYQENLNDTVIAIQNQCRAKAHNIQLRNTTSYFTEILEAHADKLGIEDLLPYAKEIDKLSPY